MLVSFLFVTILFLVSPCADTFRLESSRRLYSQRFSMSAEVDNLVKKIQTATPAKSVVVIKYGGHAMENDEFKNLFCQDIATLCKVSYISISSLNYS